MKIDRDDVLVAACYSSVEAFRDGFTPDHVLDPHEEKKNLSICINYWDSKIIELQLENKDTEEIIEILNPINDQDYWALKTYLEVRKAMNNLGIKNDK